MTTKEKTTYRRSLAKLNKQELAYAVGGALRFKCVDMEFNWPGNAKMTQDTMNRPHVICDLMGNIYIESKGSTEPFEPQTGSLFVTDMIREIGAMEITYTGVSENPAIRLNNKVRVVVRDSKRFDIMYAYESPNLDDLPLLLARALVRTRIGVMITLPLGLKKTHKNETK